MFATLRARTRETLVVGDAETLDPFAGSALSFGFSDTADIRGEDVELDAASSRFRVEDVAFTLPVPGAHNVANALAAIAAASVVGVALDEMAEPAGRLPGHWPAVPDHRQGARHRGDRRFRAQRREDRGGDQDGAAPSRSACSPSISRMATGRRASCATTSSRLSPASSSRTTVCGCSKCSTRAARPRATSPRPISSPRSARRALTPSSRRRDSGSSRASPRRRRPGDLVLVMGARDPSLTELARAILAAIESADGAGPGEMIAALSSVAEQAVDRVVSRRGRSSALRLLPACRRRLDRDELRRLAEQRRGHLGVEAIDVGEGLGLALLVRPSW